MRDDRRWFWVLQIDHYRRMRVASIEHGDLEGAKKLSARHRECGTMAWETARKGVPMNYKTAQEQRLHDLALAMMIPWPSGFPQYWLDAENQELRESEIFEATKTLKLPWSQ
jgi:hypothetical protein